MKKIRIILPALTVIALSLGAAVTGTVAWFTANRNVTSTSSPISLINPEGNLSVTGHGLFGTTTPVDQSSGLMITHSANFRDGSFDITDGTVYKSSLDTNGSVSAFEAVGPSAMVLNEPHNKNDIAQGYIDGQTHVAQAYQLKFSYGDKDTMPGTYGIFFDGTPYDKGTQKGSGITENDASAKGHPACALRVAFMCVTDGQTSNRFVYGPSAFTSLANPNADDNCLNYVGGLTLANVGSYVDNQIAKKLRIEDYNNDKTPDNFLGNIVIDDINKGPQTLEVNVWTWFEGCDENNISDKIDLTNFKPISMQLNFNVIRQEPKVA